MYIVVSCNLPTACIFNFGCRLGFLQNLPSNRNDERTFFFLFTQKKERSAIVRDNQYIEEQGLPNLYFLFTQKRSEKLIVRFISFPAKPGNQYKAK